MGRRRQARETALQALYLADTARMTPEDALAIVGTAELDEKSAAFARSLVDGAWSRLRETDEALAETARNWELPRMAAVDRAVLRLAAYELLQCPETPVSVIIDEALEIVKKYSSEESSRFINGILGKLKDRRPEAPPAKD